MEKATKEIKGIIFDYGGIFSNRAMLNEFAEEYGKKKKIGVEKFGKVLDENWQKAKIDEIPSTRFWTNIAEEIELDAKEFRKEFVSWFGFDEKMKELVSGLQGKYKLGMLSNQIEDWLEELLDYHDIRKLFDVLVTSYGEKVAKPNPEIYRRVIEKMGLNPEEMVFIDDLERNLLPAREAGLNVIKYENIDGLKKELVALGITL